MVWRSFSAADGLHIHAFEYVPLASKTFSLKTIDGTGDSNNKLNPKLELLNSKSPTLKKHIRRLTLMIDRYDHDYECDPQRRRDVLTLLSDTFNQLRDLIFQFSGTIRDYKENEDPDEQDLAETILPIRRFAKGLYQGQLIT